MRPIHRMALTISAALSLAAVCDRSRMVRGVVLGCEDRRPIADAVVVSYGESNPYKHSLQKSEPDGSFAIAVNQAGEPAVLVVTAPGREALRREVTDTDRAQTLCLPTATAKPR
jgi:hypothetical protein